MEEQEALHALSVSRMHQFVKSAERIKQIALKFGLPKRAASEIRNLLDLPVDILLKVLKDLMTTECIKLSREEAEMNVLMDPALGLYLSLGMKVVDLTAYLSFCPIRLKYQYLKQAVLRIVKISPNIEELLLQSKIPNYKRIYDTVVDEELLEALGKLTKLRVLQIDEWCCIEIKDLFKLCDKLPKLQYLRVTLPDSYNDFVYNEDEILDDLKRSMSKLREFLYFARGNSSLRYTCLKHLPNLRAIEEYTELFYFSDDDESTEPETIRPRISNLRHFNGDLNHERSVCKDMHLIYPNINHLELFWYEEDVWENYASQLEEQVWPYLLHFPQLESLNLADFPVHVARCFLESYGLNLRALSIMKDVDKASGDFLTFEELFTACPKLEKLTFGRDIKDPKLIGFYANLRVLELQLTPYCEERNELLNILRAPNLEKVTLRCSGLSVRDLERLTSLVAEKQILRKINTLVVELDFNTFGLLSNNIDHFRKNVEFLKCAVTSITTLTCVKFYLNIRRSEYSTMARSLRENRITNEEIPDVAAFFRDIQIIDSNTNPASWFVDEELILILDSFKTNEIFGGRIKLLYSA